MNGLINVNLGNMGKLAEPATKLIEKISEAVGGLSRPYQIKRVAKANAEAAFIEAKGKIKVTALEKRALNRTLAEEARKQASMESVIGKALPNLKSDASPDAVDNDWLTYFFSKSNLVSNEDMQNVWAQLLAGEANSPGSFSKRTIDLIASMDQKDAEMFNALTSFVWAGVGMPFIYSTDDEIYVNNGVNFMTLNHLDSIGLIKYESLASFSTERFAGNQIAYQKDTFDIAYPEGKSRDISFGKVVFTAAGSELASICSPKPIKGFVEYVTEKLDSQGIKLTPIPR